MSNPKHIKNIIDEFISTQHWEDKILIESIPIVWEKYIGYKLSSIASYQRFENGIIYIKVPLAPWRNELILRRQDYISLMNSHLDKPLIHDIIFR